MDKYIISGIQQIGIGVENFSEAWKHYIDVFNMDIRILEDDTVAELMLPYTGGSPQKRHACIALNMQGGGGFEIWQYSERKPKTIDFDINFGDYGVIAAKIKSRNVKQSYEEFSKKKEIQILGNLSKGIDGNKTFFIKDKYGNIFQIIYDNYILRDEKRSTGGIVGGIIGVSNIEKSLVVYRDILGYDKVLSDETGNFEDISGLNSGNQKFRRVLL
ncbi:MAG: VOC family protein, partial [Bacteroidales bacterium]|nr:VOC family protein [Bacteroidales bacterium]